MHPGRPVLLTILGPFAAVAVAGCGLPPRDEEPPRVEITTAFDAAYRRASDELGVPYELLRGVGAAQSGHHRIDGSISESGQSGVMGLTPEVIGEAARLLGLPAEVIATDDVANIRGAAAVIADRRLRGATWNGAALAVTGLRDEGLRARWLQAYARHLRLAGELVPEMPSAIGSAVAGGGEFPGSDWVPAYSGNYTNASRGDGDVSFVIIHDVEGTYEGCIAWFQNPSAHVSAHYVVADEGDITQMVREEDIGWHAGNWSYNQASVGIEHEGYAADPSSYPETMYVASAALTRYLTARYSIPRTRDYVIAHAQVPGTTHTDPGPYWDWDHYMELVDAAAPKAKLVGFVREGDIYEGPGIAGATVDLGDGRTATTGADGYYEILDLAPGLYTVTASADGYQTGVDEKAIEDGGGTWWKSFALVPAAPTGGGDEPGGDLPGAHGALDGGACSVAVAAPASPCPLAATILTLGAGAMAIARRRRSRGRS